MSVIIGADDIVGAADDIGFVSRLKRHGARFGVMKKHGSVEYLATLPRRGGGVVVVRHDEPVQDAQVGGKVGKKIKKKLKAAAKKVAKSKVLKVMTKAAGKMGNVLPGPLGMQLKLAAKGMNAAVKLAAGKKKAASQGSGAAGGKLVTTASGRQYRVTPA
jgi:hypothetical protein